MKIPIKIGQRYGAWVVLKELGYSSKYQCQCDCGITSPCRAYDLAQGKTRSCKQCTTKQRSGAALMSHDPAYGCWGHMVSRCTNKSNKDYKNYGGRGIQVCDLWKDSFETFLMQMGPRPSVYHSLERLDVNGNYEAGNVTWATVAEQSVNKRSTVRITIEGETKAVSEWAEDPRCVVTAKVVYKRIERGWDPVKAVLTPTKGK